MAEIVKSSPSSTKLPIDRQMRLLFSEHLSGVIFEVGDSCELIHAHRVILSIGSEVFYAMFNADTEQDYHENPIFIEDVTPATFKEVLRFIYYGEIDLSIENIREICYMSEKYILTNLRGKCKGLFETIVNEDNALKNLNNDLSYSFDFLDEICMKYIRDNPLKYFKSKRFLTLSESTVKLIADSRIMNCQKKQLCEAIQSWRLANNSTVAILPKLELMQCRKLHAYGEFHYEQDIDTDFIIQFEQPLHLYGVGVFVGKKSTSRRSKDVLVTIQINDVSVSKQTYLKANMHIEEIVFERITVEKTCHIKATIKDQSGHVAKPFMFCLKRFKLVDTEGVKILEIEHQTANCVAYLLFNLI